MARSKISFSLEIFNLARNLDFLGSLGPLGLVNSQKLLDCTCDVCNVTVICLILRAPAFASNTEREQTEWTQTDLGLRGIRGYVILMN